ncbi:swr complex subunit [Ciborinia camelliae]|nr:swr complex subunit [Ciborinia camelliae]
MTSHDVRDMLDLPSSSSAPRPKKAKTTIQKPKLAGLAREVQNLGGDNPIAIVPEEAVFKKKRFGSRKPAAKWEERKFKNSARGGDGLVLKHWRKVEGREREREKERDAEGDTEMGDNVEDGKGKEKEDEAFEDSTFAKYNVKVQVPTYTDEEYKEILENEEWSRHETDYLMRMVQEYDLRWPVIWDRYEYILPDIPEDGPKDAMIRRGEVRTLEDLKARYYSIGAAMMALKKPLHQMNTAEFDLHQKMLNYQPRQEKLRKDFLEGVFTRTKEEAREEESLMVELKRILARSEKFMEERRELYARLDAPSSSSNIGPYTTSVGLNTLLATLYNADRYKKKKTIPEGQTPGGATPVGANTPGGYNDRRDSNVRESISGPSGTAGNSSAVGNKKGSISSSTQNPSERRRLSEEEEKVYGVTHYDRLTGGPVFRGEKLLKPMTSKSSIQQTRIKNTLAELGIGEKATMPTIDVAHAYDELFKSIGILLDSKKVVDKLAGEIAVVKEQLEEKRRRKARNMGMDGAGDDNDAEAKDENGNGNGGDKREGESEESGVSSLVPSTEQGDGNNEDLDGKEKESEDANGNAEDNDDGDGNGDKDAGVKAAAAHKRSASVLSAASDKSSKRQKK